jgi:hypothetical protein
MSISADNGSVLRPAGAPFTNLLRFELARAFGRRHAVALAALALMAVLLTFWLPTFPDTVHLFFLRIFQLQTWAEIVVANELTGIVFFVFWVGAFDVFAIYVVPFEEHHLDLYLSKPLTRYQYMFARLLPIMVTVTSLGTSSALVLWLALASAGLDFPLLPLIGASAVVIAWTACLVSIVNIVILATRETYTAALIAFAILAFAMLPGSVYMYRPDLFTDAPLLRTLLVFPLTLLWHASFSARWGLPLAALFLGITVALIAAAGERIEARDVR